MRLPCRCITSDKMKKVAVQLATRIGLKFEIFMSMFYIPDSASPSRIVRVSKLLRGIERRHALFKNQVRLFHPGHLVCKAFIILEAVT